MTVKAVVSDFDGTLTDGYVYLDELGKETVRCSRKDSYGFYQLKELGVKLLVLTSETNPVVNQRCIKMGVRRVVAGRNPQDKLSDLKKWMVEQSLTFQDIIVYIGDDVNDLHCMAHPDIFSVAVADAHPDIIANSDYVLNSRGGNGAFRELSDLIIKGKLIDFTIIDTDANSKGGVVMEKKAFLVNE